MADAVTATLTKRNGEIKEFKDVIAKEKGQNGKNLDALINSLTKIQKEVNENLTELVEDERGNTQTKLKSIQDNDLEEDDDEDDDDDDVHNNITKTINSSSEPIPKKIKV